MLYLNDKTGTGRGIDMGVQETPEKKKSTDESSDNHCAGVGTAS